MTTKQKKNTARPKASLRNCSEHYWENGAHFFKESAAVLVLGCEKMLLWIQIKANRCYTISKRAFAVQCERTSCNSGGMRSVRAEMISHLKDNSKISKVSSSHELNILGFWTFGWTKQDDEDGKMKILFYVSLLSTGRSLCETVTFSFQVTMAELRLGGIRCNHHAAMVTQPQERERDTGTVQLESIIYWDTDIFYPIFLCTLYIDKLLFFDKPQTAKINK